MLARGASVARHHQANRPDGFGRRTHIAFAMELLKKRGQLVATRVPQEYQSLAFSRDLISQERIRPIGVFCERSTILSSADQRKPLSSSQPKINESPQRFERRASGESTKLFYSLFYVTLISKTTELRYRFPNSIIFKLLSVIADNAVLIALPYSKMLTDIAGLSTNKKDVFIICADNDRDVARNISVLLEIEGYNTFSAFKNSRSSAPIPAQTYFEKHFYESSVIITILSNASKNSLYCDAEMKAAFCQARDSNAKLIHFLVEPVEPSQFGIEMDYVSLVGLSHTEKRTAILSAIASAAEVPKPLESISAPFTFGWTASHRIGVLAGPENTPSFFHSESEKDHSQRLNACREMATRLTADLKSRSYNVREGYLRTLERYLSDLPMAAGDGNFIVADCEARVLRGMFEADADTLSRDFAERLNRILELNTALRPYYEGVGRFYDDVKRGTLSQPLPRDAVEGFAREIAEHTPNVFESEVSTALYEVQHAPTLEVASRKPHDESSSTLVPRPDPIDAPDPVKLHNYGQASTVNAIYAAFLKGRDISSAVKGWDDIAQSLSRHAGPVIEWLRSYFPPG